MSIPSIEAYDPSRLSLPENKLNWRIERHRTAVLIHDVQNFFVRPLPAATENELIKAIDRICKWAAKHDIPVVYSVQPGGMTRLERGLLRDLWGPGMSGRKEDTDVISRIWDRYPGQKVTKWRYSAFFGTNLSMLLTDMKRDQLVVAGLYAHLGVWATAMDAFSANIETTVASDAVADFTADRHEFALEQIASSCSRVASSAEVVSS